MKKKIDFGFNPVAKPVKKEKKVDTKLKPYMKKRPKKAKREKNPLKKEIYNGRSIPLKQQRGRITTAEYNEAARRHGEHCFFCGATTNLECHHVMPKGYSRIKSGRGKFRNLRFLCNECHTGTDGVHKNAEKMKILQDEHERLYSNFYWCDEFDLFQMQLIPEPTKEEYEKFFKEQEKEMQRKRVFRNDKP
jgi:hypothetical protein